MNVSKLLSAMMNDDFRQKTEIEKAAELKEMLPGKTDAQVVEAYEEAVRQVDPNYRPLTKGEKAARKDVHELAVSKFSDFALRHIKSTDKVDIAGLDRDMLTLFNGLGDSAGDIQEKEWIEGILKGGDPEKLHGLFTETMNKLASFNLEEFNQLDISEKLERMDEFMPVLMTASVGQALLDGFERMGAGITEEEKKLFKTLSSQLSEADYEFQRQISVTLDPLYAQINVESCSMDTDIQDKMENVYENPQLAQIKEYHQHVDEYRISESNRRRSNIKDYLVETGKAEKVMDIGACDKDGNRINGEEPSNADLKKLDEGKTIYYNSEKGNPDSVVAFKDVLNNGVPVEVPKEVPKPNGFLYFVHNVLRFFGSKGLDSVNKYEEYEKKLEDITAKAAQNPPPSQYRKFNEAAGAAKKIIQASRQKAAEIDEAQNELVNAPEEPAVEPLNPEEEQARQDRAALQEELDQMEEEERDMADEPEENLMDTQAVLREMKQTAKANMRILMQDAADEAEKDPIFTYKIELANILLSDVAEKMVAEHEEQYSEESTPRFTKAANMEYGQLDLQNAVMEQPAFRKAAAMRGTEIVKLLRDPERREELVNALVPAVTKSVNKLLGLDIGEAFAEKPEVEMPKSKEAETSWRNPLSEEQTVQKFGSEANREKAIGLLYKEIAAKMEKKKNVISPEDARWIESHKELMLSAREEALERYEKDADASARERVEEEARNRVEDLQKGGAVVQQILRDVSKMTAEQRQFVRHHPVAMRDAFEDARKDFLEQNMEPYTEEQERTLHAIDNGIQVYSEDALKKGDPFAVAQYNRSRQSEEVRTMSDTIASDIMNHGNMSPEQAEWAIDHLTPVRDALAVAKHNYTRKHDMEEHTARYQDVILNLDKYAANPSKMAKMAREVINKAAETQNRERTQRKEEIRSRL